MDQMKLVPVGAVPQVLYRQHNGGTTAPMPHQPQVRKYREEHKRMPLEAQYKPSPLSPPGRSAAPPYPPYHSGGDRYHNSSLLYHREGPPPPAVHYQRMERGAMPPTNRSRPSIMGPNFRYNNRDAQALPLNSINSAANSLGPGSNSALNSSNTISVPIALENNKRIRLSQPPQPIVNTNSNNSTNSIRVASHASLQQMSNSSSLLHHPHTPANTQIIPPPTSSRLQQHVPMETECSTTRDTYYPQVEAISPTPADPPSDPISESKDFILHQIELVDKDLSNYESTVKMKQKKADELVQAGVAKSEDEDADVDVEGGDEERLLPKSRTLAQRLYDANRRLVTKHDALPARLMRQPARVDCLPLLPQYRQPPDTPAYARNKLQFYEAGLKQRILTVAKASCIAEAARLAAFNDSYNPSRASWCKKAERAEGVRRGRDKFARSRELFEKVFQELRKQREEKERFSRVGARVKSDAEMEEIMDGLQEQENEEKKMRSYAVIPPIKYQPDRKGHHFLNTNGLLNPKDILDNYKENKNVNIWSAHEKAIFRERYLQHPKNFSVIASYLDKKTVHECIQYYYLSKRTENYKAQVKRRIRRPRAKGSAHNNSHNNPNNTGSDSISSGSIGSEGVTTRGSLQKEIQAIPSSIASLGSASTTSIITDVVSTTATTSCSSSSNSSSCISSSNSVTVTFTTSSTSGGLSSASVTASGEESRPAHCSDSTAATSSLTDTAVTTAASSSLKADVSSSLNAAVSSSSNIAVSSCLSTAVSSCLNTAVSSVLNTAVSSSLSTAVSSSATPAVFPSVNPDDRAAVSSEDEPMEEEDLGAHQCVVCLASVSSYAGSRVLPPHQYRVYGLPAPTTPPSPVPSRVCHHCRQKQPPTRRVLCPVGTCRTPSRCIRRLRPLPRNWADLPPALTSAIARELSIPPHATAVCTSCLGQVQERMLGSDTAWSAQETQALYSALSVLGRQWARVAERVGTRTPGQCKSFYNNLKHVAKYRLREAVQRYKRSTVTAPSRLSSSGSSTDSCDEASHPPPRGLHRDSTSDTASASSPLTGTLGFESTCR